MTYPTPATSSPSIERCVHLFSRKATHHNSATHPPPHPILRRPLRVLILHSNHVRRRRLRRRRPPRPHSAEPPRPEVAPLDLRWRQRWCRQDHNILFIGNPTVRTSATNLVFTTNNLTEPKPVNPSSSSPPTPRTTFPTPSPKSSAKMLAQSKAFPTSPPWRLIPTAASAT